MFIALTQSRVAGGFSDDTVACLLSFAREHVHFVEITTTLDPATLTPAEFAEIGRDGFRMFECMSEDEIVRMQEFGAGTSQGSSQSGPRGRTAHLRTQRRGAALPRVHARRGGAAPPARSCLVKSLAVLA